MIKTRSFALNEFLLRFASKYTSLILSFHLHYNLHYFIKQTRSIVQDKTNTHIHIYITRLFSKASLWPRSLLEQHKSRTVIKVTSVATFERGIIRNRRDGGTRVGGGAQVSKQRDSYPITRRKSEAFLTLEGLDIGYSVRPRCNFAVRLDLEEWHNLRVSLRSTDPASNDVSRVSFRCRPRHDRSDGSKRDASSSKTLRVNYLI